MQRPWRLRFKRNESSLPCGHGNRILVCGQTPHGRLLARSSRAESMTETATDFIARKSAEWERERARGRLIRMKDVNREAIHVYRRDAWTFLVQDTYAEAVNVLERLTPRDHRRTGRTDEASRSLVPARLLHRWPYRQGIRQVGVGSVQPDHVGGGLGAHRGEGSRRGHPAGSRSSCGRCTEVNAVRMSFAHRAARSATLARSAAPVLSGHVSMSSADGAGVS
jgi:hypothetical protein